MLPWILCQNGTQVWRQIYEIEVHFPDDTTVVLPENVIINIQRVVAQSITLCPVGKCTDVKDKMTIFNRFHGSSEIYIYIKIFKKSLWKHKWRIIPATINGGVWVVETIFFSTQLFCISVQKETWIHSRL